MTRIIIAFKTSKFYIIINFHTKQIICFNVTIFSLVSNFSRFRFRTSCTAISSTYTFFPFLPTTFILVSSSSTTP